MLSSLKQLDGILRGETTRLSALRTGALDLPIAGLFVVLIVLGMLYGVCMGLYAVIDRGWQGFPQMFATMTKVPLLFLLTLIVTFPSLYVFNALVGSRLSIRSVFRLLIAALGVMLTVLASFGTIVAFFSVSTKSYPFMKLLNVVVFAIAGFLGLAFLLQTLHRLTIIQEEQELASLPTPPALPPPDAPPLPAEQGAAEPPTPLREPGALERTEGHVLSRHVKMVFQIWVIVFGLVGAQMGWVLRPFIGDPDMPFTLFRQRESNFFEAVWKALQSLFGG